MINASIYAEHVGSTVQNRRLMTRIALNALGHAQEFPVDLSELRKLSPMNLAITNGFLNWSDLHSDYRYGLLLKTMKEVARGELHLYDEVKPSASAG